MENAERKKKVGKMESADESALLVGKTLGTFQILEIVGKGGMGIVYRADDCALNRTVALKVLSPELRDQAFLQRFVREARISAKLDHPNIVHVYTIASADAGPAGAKVWYIAMQYVEGRTIASYLQGNRRFAARKALLTARYVAEALRVAHEAGVIHRDIKPNNIMIDRQGKIKVMDFGLARSIYPSAGVTQTGTYLGTPAYSSPEQCVSSEIDGRSDIYSLGVVLYEMLSGRVPHEAETPFAIFKKIVDEPPVPLNELNPTLSPQIVRLVQRMMAKNRDDRYQTMAEVVREIDSLLKSENAGREADDKRANVAPTPLPQTPVDGKKLRTPARHRRLFTQRKRSPAWMVFGSLAALSLIAIAGYLLINAKTSSSPKPLVSQPPAPRVADSPAAKQPEKMTALVFDFQNLSQREEAKWLEIAIPDLLIADISQCDALNVVSRINLMESTKKIAGKRVAISEEDRVTLRKELGGAIEYFRGDIAVQGSFYVPEGKKIRIVAALFRCENGKLADLGACQVDGDNYEEGLLAMVDALSAKIVDAIRKRGADLKVANVERLTLDGGRPIAQLMASLPATAGKNRERKVDEQDKSQRGDGGFGGTEKAAGEGRSAAPGDAKPAAAESTAQAQRKNDDLKAQAETEVGAPPSAKGKAEAQEKKAEALKDDGNLMEALRTHYRQLWEKEAAEFPR